MCDDIYDTLLFSYHWALGDHSNSVEKGALHWELGSW
jgi:hypothetical protein